MMNASQTTATETNENANISISPGIKDLFDLDSELRCRLTQVKWPLTVLFTHQSQFLPAVGSLQVLFLNPVTLKALKFLLQ